MRALVTGGGGFLGSGLVRRLTERGDEVRSLARGAYPELTALGAEAIQGDLRDADAVARACQGVEVVFHTAAKAASWGDPAEFHAINVQGTRNVIAGCRAAGVRTLVFTSSPSVVHAPHDIEGADESIPYATHFTADYPRTKALSEQEVRAASDERLVTVSLRPHLIWGPGDRHLLPRLAERSRAGKLRQVGYRDAKTDTTYIDNCVDAHLLAAEKLLAGAALGGKAYFISDGDPVGVWTMANRMLAAAGAPPAKSPIPGWLAYAAGAGLEALHTVTRNEREPVMTRFLASELAHAQWFDIGAARRDLGYEPKVSIEAGLRRLAEWARSR